MAAFVTFEDVSKVYRSGEVEIRAVDHISFTIEKGEFCVIVGPSGAGKTTVLNMLGGMDACSGGSGQHDAPECADLAQYDEHSRDGESHL